MSTKFTHAPNDWTIDFANKVAQEDGIELSNDHLEVIRALQEYFSKKEHHINIRELTDALNESFHSKGGTKYLFTLFPKGPVAQGCRLAGLEIPSSAIDKNFGSVF